MKQIVMNLSIVEKLLNSKQKILKLLNLFRTQETFQKNFLQTGLNGYVYDFSINYDAIAVGDILDM